mgnify:CR=1 FL=1
MFLSLRLLARNEYKITNYEMITVERPQEDSWLMRNCKNTSQIFTVSLLDSSLSILLQNSPTELSRFVQLNECHWQELQQKINCIKHNEQTVAGRERRRRRGKKLFCNKSSVQLIIRLGKQAVENRNNILSLIIFIFLTFCPSSCSSFP